MAKRGIMKALRWIGLQALCAPLIVIGWFLLPLPCMLKAWHRAPATKNRIPYTFINTWNWIPWLWGNDEDGVTGKPGYNDSLGRWKAYTWSAWRNPVDNYKYLSWTQGTGIWKLTIFGLKFQFGWNPSGLIVASRI